MHKTKLWFILVLKLSSLTSRPLGFFFVSEARSKGNGSECICCTKVDSKTRTQSTATTSTRSVLDRLRQLRERKTKTKAHARGILINKACSHSTANTGPGSFTTTRVNRLGFSFIFFYYFCLRQH